MLVEVHEDDIDKVVHESLTQSLALLEEFSSTPRFSFNAELEERNVRKLRRAMKRVIKYYEA